MTKADELTNAALDRLLQIIRVGTNEEALMAINTYAGLVEITQGTTDANG